jgi:hypothetical protein
MRVALPDALRHGMISVVVGSPDPEATLQSYVDFYLREEIQAEGLTRNIGVPSGPQVIVPGLLHIIRNRRCQEFLPRNSQAPDEKLF